MYTQSGKNHPAIWRRRAHWEQLRGKSSQAEGPAQPEYQPGAPQITEAAAPIPIADPLGHPAGEQESKSGDLNCCHHRHESQFPNSQHIPSHRHSCERRNPHPTHPERPNRIQRRSGQTHAGGVRFTQPGVTPQESKRHPFNNEPRLRGHDMHMHH